MPGLLAAALLFHPRFEGMPSVGGGDAGNHLSIHHHFLHDNVKTYFGFAAGYALMGLLEALHFDTFEAFRAVWYLVFFSVSGVFGFFCASLQKNKAAVLAIAFTASWFLFVGPEIHYQQADGFFAHAYSMALLLTFVVAAQFIETRWLIAVSMAFFAALRFSYGLNLGDVALALSVAFAFLPLPKKIRFSAAALMLIVGIAAWVNLWPIFEDTGSMVEPRFKMRLLGTALSGVALLILRRRFAASQRFVFDFVAALCLLSVATDLLIWTRYVPRYYFFKHQTLPALAGLLALFGAMGSLEWQPQKPWAFFLLTALVVAAQGRASWPNSGSFYERVFRSAQPKRIYPLTFRGVERQIEAVTLQERLPVSGVVTSDWHRYTFWNGRFDAFDVFAYGAGYFPNAIPQRTDACHFWVDAAAPSDSRCTQVSDPTQVEPIVVCWKCTRATE